LARVRAGVGFYLLDDPAAGRAVEGPPV